MSSLAYKKTPEQLAKKAAYDRLQKVIRTARKKAKEIKAMEFQTAHPEIQRDQQRERNMQTTRTWWGGA